jgi:sigma-B regulation protein RsbU (phosphoserine phosphatase)
MSMRVLIAEDDPLALRTLGSALAAAGYEVCAVTDGLAALKALHAADAPLLAVLDWMMPGLDGVEVIRMVRSVPTTPAPYLIILTAKEELEDVVVALESGANDFVIKTHDIRELVSRVRVGERVIGLQIELARRAQEAERALAHIKRLQGLLPICSYCKKIRNDQNYWQEIEHYIHDHSEADFTHGICPGCYEKVLKPQMENFQTKRGGA